MNKEYIIVEADDFIDMVNSDFARPITGFNGKYYITRDGRVISTKKAHLDKIIILRTAVNKWGYEKVDLGRNSDRTKRLHRLVAESFIPNPNNYKCVNHKNEIKIDNRVENLEWCTAEYNMDYGTRKERQRKAVSKKVMQIDSNGNILKIWNSTKEAGRNGYQDSQICRCANGKAKTHRGYTWKYSQ